MSLCVLHGVPKPLTVTIGARDQDCQKNLTERTGDRELREVDQQGREVWMRAPSERGGRFTNMAVPRFNGDSCWQQHLQIIKAIVRSNGWTDEMAALQLFAHLNGDALNVALLMPEGERANWERLSQGLSD